MIKFLSSVDFTKNKLVCFEVTNKEQSHAVCTPLSIT